MKNIFWSGYSALGRYETISTVQKVVQPYGDITGFQPFSDLALTVTIELPERHTDALFAALGDVIGMDPAAPVTSVSDRERTVYLHINFACGTGNLRTETPDVPG
jgi:hypothetical protein